MQPNTIALPAYWENSPSVWDDQNSFYIQSLDENAIVYFRRCRLLKMPVITKKWERESNTNSWLEKTYVVSILNKKSTLSIYNKYFHFSAWYRCFMDIRWILSELEENWIDFREENCFCRNIPSWCHNKYLCIWCMYICISSILFVYFYRFYLFNHSLSHLKGEVPILI